MRALDLFCGAGGAAMGLHRAGFDVVGVDNRPMPRYPFTFVQADALEPPFDLASFDLIWASPPCQAYTAMSNRWRGNGGKSDSHPDLVAGTRELLESSGVPYIIENVRGAPLRFPVTLSGGMFGLGVHRPRLFECSFVALVPHAQTPPERQVGVYGKAPDGRLLWRRTDGTELRAASSLNAGAEAMGIDWMDWHSLAQAIPPAYSEYLARAFLDQL